MKNNCDDCPKQSTCKFGFTPYDAIEKRNYTLWEKYNFIRFDDNIADFNGMKCHNAYNRYLGFPKGEIHSQLKVNYKEGN